MRGSVSTDRPGDGGGDEERQGVGPRQQLVLLPPALHHQAHVEAQHERHRDALALRAEVLPHLLEHPAAHQNTISSPPTVLVGRQHCVLTLVIPKHFILCITCSNSARRARPHSSHVTSVNCSEHTKMARQIVC